MGKRISSPFAGGQVQPCTGVIGDGDFGATSDDFDIRAIDVFDANAIMIADAVRLDAAPASFAVSIACGDLFGSFDDLGGDSGVAPLSVVT